MFNEMQVRQSKEFKQLCKEVKKELKQRLSKFKYRRKKIRENH